MPAEPATKHYDFGQTFCFRTILTAKKTDPQSVSLPHTFSDLLPHLQLRVFVEILELAIK